MRHAREDYERIQDPSGKIPEDEPVFLIRGQDLAGPAAVEAWALRAASLGASMEIVEKALVHADQMRKWQKQCASKTPDLPDASHS